MLAKISAQLEYKILQEIKKQRIYALIYYHFLRHNKHKIILLYNLNTFVTN